ncbi:hypothetical protein BH11GEM2_BH11GEM2_37710 [soil metagenome]
MDKVKEVRALVATGRTIPEAIKRVLDMPVVAFCDKHGIPRGTGSNHLNATVRASDATIAALVAELGGTENEWREMLWKAMRPAHLAVS